MRRDRGFTLTELLIVIAIIGILAGIILVSGGSVRQDARDKKRKADVEQIAGLLQIKLAQEKTLSGVPAQSSANCANFLRAALVTPPNAYTTQIPCDPLNTGSHIYSYVPAGSGAIGSCPTYTFAVRATLEGTGGNNSPCRAGNQDYTIVGN